MLERFVFENPWPVAIGLAAIGVLLVRFSLVTTRKPFLFLGAFALIAGVAAAVAGWAVETPVKQVDRVLDLLIQAGLTRDAVAIEKHIAGNFEHEGLTRAALVEHLRREFENFTPQTLKFNGRQFRKDGDHLVADFVAVTSGQYRQTPVNFYPIRARATFEKVGSTWQIIRLQRFDPAGNLNRELPLFSK